MDNGIVRKLEDRGKKPGVQKELCVFVVNNQKWGIDKVFCSLVGIFHRN